jgi:hypothetical protein
MNRLLATGLTLAALGLAVAHAQPIPPMSDRPYPGAITLQIDTTDIDRKI